MSTDRRPLWISFLIFNLVFIPVFSLAEDRVGDDEALLEITDQESYAAYLKNQTSWYELLNPKTNEGIFYSYAAEMALPAAAPEMSKSTVGGAGEYSTTNVQVIGVDEADFLKNDGKYIYQIKDDSLIISEVYPVETGKVSSVTNISGTPSELFLSGDRLVIFSNNYDESLPVIEPGVANNQLDTTHAIIYDVSDRSGPAIVREITLPGLYENARMIGDIVYTLTKQYSYSSNGYIPLLYENGKVTARPSIWCPPIPLSSYDVYTLSAFSLNGTAEPNATSFLMGWDNTLYVSPENAYVAYEKWTPYWWGRGTRSGEDPGDESVIHRFSLNNGIVSYEATGTFPGSLLNQFSLDEYDNHIRVATTNSWYTGDEWTSDNNVYVLTPDLNITGSLEHLASGEQIYAARFMGDLLYLVTYEQMDPLFVIDLSNPDQPGILGELKIPGYSDYLHPFDATHIIGIGKDTTESEWGGVIPAGVKIALFDVSDLTNPREVDHRIIGEKGSTSAVLDDHHAFLLNMNRSIMVLPVKEVVRVPVPVSSYNESYTTAAWQGAYVFGIDPEQGFTEKGKVEQAPVKPDQYWSDSTVQRSVVMDGNLYTVSKDRIIASDLENPSKRLFILDI